jgi:hypothetical protein
MPPVEFEPTISAGERPKTYALDRAAIVTPRLVHPKPGYAAVLLLSSDIPRRGSAPCTVYSCITPTTLDLIQTR